MMDKSGQKFSTLLQKTLQKFDKYVIKIFIQAKLLWNLQLQ